MRFRLYFLCSAMGALLLASCGGGSLTPDQHSTPALDSLLADTALMGEEAIAPAEHGNDTLPGNVKPAKIKMANDLDYSADFLKELTYSGLAENIELADSFIILNGKDTLVFPMDLPKGRWSNFVASKQGYVYSLDISKSNYTTLDFNFELRKGRHTVEQMEGKADMGYGFIYGTESDEDESTGNSYFVNVYVYETPDCFFEIRIGDDDGIWKAKVKKQCKSGKYNIELDDCPVLLEK